ncbi:MAG: hypothetical protein WCD31_03730 [Gillisia sp.]
MKKLFDFYISSSIHVALAVVSLSVITVHNFEVPINYRLELFIFLGTITGYNFVKYAGIAGLHHLSLTRNLRFIQVFSFVAFLFLIYFSFLQTFRVLLISGILGLFTVLYVLPVFSESRNLRGLPNTKIFIISLVWAGVTVLLPLTDHVDLFQPDVFISFVQRFCIVMALILPFDIRDLRFDMANLGTIPQHLGVRKTRVFGILLLCLVFLMELLKQHQELTSSISLFVAAIAGMLLIRYSVIRQAKYYASFWVEGVPIFWLGMLYFLEFIL